MGETDGTDRQEDRYDLHRFIRAQASAYRGALAELKGCRKQTHWMWFVFPQLAGLGQSATSEYYAVKSLAEARAYLDHPVLGPRIVECAEAVLACRGRAPAEIFGSPDDLKLRSSMTLFARAVGQPSVFSRVIEQFFGDRPDGRTVELLESKARGE